MNIDLGSFAFGTSLKVGSGTPSWGTALGQSSPSYRITRDGSDRILIGMLYCAIPKKDIKMPIGKGGHVVSGDQADEIQLAALFNKVYVNGIKIEYPFILILQKEESNSHPGRRSLKYSDKISYQGNGKTYSNDLFIREVTHTLNLADKACWFAYKIDVENQDTLHISIVVVNENESIEYNNSEERKNKWTQLITEKEADIPATKSSPTKNPLFHPNNEITNLLKEKKNVILTGAPGTGKTFTAKAIAAEIISDGNSDWDNLTEEQKKQVAFVQFHPSYDYTDFVEGLRPIAGGEFQRQDGVFKAFCKQSVMNSIGQGDIKTVSPQPYIFIIDEINRGELSKIFGELFYAIEPDYRGPKGTVQTQYNNMVEDDDVFKSGFYIPENVYIIGTMNDVDRSVEAMDFAIRRRFAWIEVTAEESADNMGITGLALERMKALNKALIERGLSRACCIGGAYFRKLKNEDYDSLWKYHLEGIVYEYFRGEPDADEKLQAVKKAYEEAKLSTFEPAPDTQEETEEVSAE